MRRLMGRRASAMGGEVTIVWIIVIAVIIIGFVFVSRINLPTLIKNLPGFSGPSEEDKEIDVDLEISFNCDYPIGYIPIESGIRTLHLLDLDEIEKTEFEDIETQLKKAQKKDYLKLAADGKIFYLKEGKIFGSKKTNLGELEEEIKEQKPSGWNTIKIDPLIDHFVFDYRQQDLNGIQINPENLAEIKADLGLLYDARYISNPGWICGNSQTINVLKNVEKCVETCDIYGGECKESGEEGEIEVSGVNCNGKKCFVTTKENLVDDSLTFRNIQANSYLMSNVDSIEPDDVVSLLYGTLDFSEIKGRTLFKFDLEQTGPETLCYFIRTNNRVIRSGFYSQITEEYFDKEFMYFIPRLRDNLEDTLLISVFSPESKKIIYKVMNANPLQRTEIYSPSEIFARDKTLMGARKISNANLKEEIENNPGIGTFLITDLSVIYQELPREVFYFKIERISEDKIAIYAFDESKRAEGVEPEEIWHILDCNLPRLPFSENGGSIGSQEFLDMKNIKTTLKETLRQCIW